MGVDFNWWLVLVGVVAGGALTWLVLADAQRRERDIGEDELPRRGRLDRADRGRSRGSTPSAPSASCARTAATCASRRRTRSSIRRRCASCRPPPIRRRGRTPPRERTSPRSSRSSSLRGRSRPPRRPPARARPRTSSPAGSPARPSTGPDPRLDLAARVELPDALAVAGHLEPAAVLHAGGRRRRDPSRPSPAPRTCRRTAPCPRRRARPTSRRAPRASRPAGRRRGRHAWAVSRSTNASEVSPGRRAMPPARPAPSATTIAAATATYASQRGSRVRWSGTCGARGR